MKKIICSLLSHRYKLHREITSTIRELKCERCESLFGMNDVVQAVLPLTSDIIELHEDILKTNQ